jgi:hypothetical protein
MEAPPIVISCLTYKLFLLYFDRSCFLGVKSEILLMVREKMHDLDGTWPMGCSYSMGSKAVQVRENGPKISRIQLVEPKK